MNESPDTVVSESPELTESVPGGDADGGRPYDGEAEARRAGDTAGEASPDGDAGAVSESPEGVSADVEGSDASLADEGGYVHGGDPVEGTDGGPVLDTESDVAGELATDDDGFLVPPAEDAEAGTVVVQDFDPSDPGAELAEPQKVMNHLGPRQERKAAQRAPLDKTATDESE